MKGPEPEVTSVDTYLDSNLQSVDAAEKMVLDAAGEAGFPEEELHKISMAVREAVVNAVVHGNRYNSHKKVRLQVSRTPGELDVTVSDEGNGFDPASLPDPLAQENLLHQSGRGILLIRAFVDDFQVRRLSPSGTAVRLIKRLTQKS